VHLLELLLCCLRCFTFGSILLEIMTSNLYFLIELTPNSSLYVSNSRWPNLVNAITRSAGKIEPFSVSGGRDRDQVYPKMVLFHCVRAQFVQVKPGCSMTATRRLSILYWDLFAAMGRTPSVAQGRKGISVRQREPLAACRRVSRCVTPGAVHHNDSITAVGARSPRIHPLSLRLGPSGVHPYGAGGPRG
jgi:hypothetical protein